MKGYTQSTYCPRVVREKLSVLWNDSSSQSGFAMKIAEEFSLAHSHHTMYNVQSARPGRRSGSAVVESVENAFEGNLLGESEKIGAHWRAQQGARTWVLDYVKASNVLSLVGIG